MTRTFVLRFAPTLLAALCTTHASAAEPPEATPTIAVKDLDLQRGWFKPMPARDADPICGALATDARRYFRLTGDWARYAAADLAAGTGLERIANPSADAAAPLGLRGLPDEPEQLVLDRPNQARLFLYFSKQSACETGCAAERLIVSDQRVTPSGSEAQANAAQTPDAQAWTLYRAASGAWYAAGIVDQHLQLYALTTPQQWRLSCDVALAPYRLRQSLDPAARTALTAVDALHSVALALEGASAADCQRERPLQALEQTLYRPWQWIEESHQRGYRELQTRLTQWAATGPEQRAAFERYNTQLTAGIDTVQRFYVQKFGWTTQVATRVAHDALTGAIASGSSSIASNPGASDPSQCVKDVTGF